MKTMVFNNEEMVLVNGICSGEKLSEMKKENLVQSLLFSRQITDDDNTMMVDLIEGALETVKSMSDAEWDELKLMIPFPVVYDSMEDVGEVPTDEDIL